MADEGQQQQQQQQQQQAKPWFDGVDAETLGHWDNKGWKYKDSPKDLAVELTKAWKGLERHFGAPADQILRLPKEATDEAGWKAIRERLGMPKEAKEYDFSSVKMAGADLEAGFVDRMRAAMHKAGVPKDAAPEIVKEVVGYLEEADKTESAQSKADYDAALARIAKEWGANFRLNELNALEATKRLGLSQEQYDKIKAAIGVDVAAEMFRKIGAGTNEDTFVDRSQGGANPVTRNGAVARKAELEADNDFMARYLKGGAKEVREMNGLIEQIVGSAA
jgi:hypothetical protein